jgi:hypothetical protein
MGMLTSQASFLATPRIHCLHTQLALLCSEKVTQAWPQVQVCDVAAQCSGEDLGIKSQQYLQCCLVSADMSALASTSLTHPDGSILP